MALAIIPIAFVIGLVVGDVRRATTIVFICWLVVMAAILVAALTGVGVSPWEALVLAVCLVPAVLLARLAARIKIRSAD